MIAVDWGTSSLRAFRLDASGVILEQRRSSAGILSCEGRYAETLQQQIIGWDDPLVLLCGMIGGRQGWVEVAYVECPATPADIVAGLVPIQEATLPGRQLWIVPGLLYRRDVPNTAELMRGEETQLCGLLNQLDQSLHIVCLPGTHSKWVCAENGRIVSFCTAMTGELYALLNTRSLLSKLLPEDPETFDHDAALQGVARAREPGGVLHHLFSVRSSALLGELRPSQLRSYLSGLLIAHELMDLPWAEQLRERPIHLIGAPALLESYELVMRQMQLQVLVHDETLAAAGMHTLALRRGLLQSI